MVLQTYWPGQFNPPLVQTQIMTISFIILLLVALLCCICRNLEDKKEQEKVEKETVEREIRYLVVCPYCGTKNPQGKERCKNCDGKL
ncbi:MAG: hypothetical protein GF309_08030 [Candidatus Lokiarchaeota archaeon]|nr:hypothetical protein [Candidatus Lokiarchaeota archaeon]